MPLSVRFCKADLTPSLQRQLAFVEPWRTPERPGNENQVLWTWRRHCAPWVHRKQMTDVIEAPQVWKLTFLKQTEIWYDFFDIGQRNTWRLIMLSDQGTLSFRCFIYGKEGGWGKYLDRFSRVHVLEIVFKEMSRTWQLLSRVDGPATARNVGQGTTWDELASRDNASDRHSMMAINVGCQRLRRGSEL
jgi:hypothetical protein